jgi:ribosomal protein L32
LPIVNRRYALLSCAPTNVGVGDLVNSDGNLVDSDYFDYISINSSGIITITIKNDIFICEICKKNFTEQVVIHYRKITVYECDICNDKKIPDNLCPECFRESISFDGHKNVRKIILDEIKKVKEEK